MACEFLRQERYRCRKVTVHASPRFGSYQPMPNTPCSWCFTWELQPVLDALGNIPLILAYGSILDLLPRVADITSPPPHPGLLHLAGTTQRRCGHRGSSRFVWVFRSQHVEQVDLGITHVQDTSRQGANAECGHARGCASASISGIPERPGVKRMERAL